jgi:hypothetical protein
MGLEGLIRAATTYIRRTCLRPDARSRACAKRLVPEVVDKCWAEAITGEAVNFVVRRSRYLRKWAVYIAAMMLKK